MAQLNRLIGEVLDSKYHLDRLLGQGGMGAVFLATHLGTTRPVAVKVIAPQFMTNEEVGERFRREAEAAGRLRHPNVVNVTDFGVATVGSDTLAYLVMEYLDGSSLGEMIKQRGALPLPLVVDIVEQICLAIGNAHQQGIIHRDLKPDNIFLQPNQRGSYIVKVLDFGLAKLGETPTPEATDQRSPHASSSAATRMNVAATNATRAVKGTQHPVEETSAKETNLGVAAQTRATEEVEAATQMQTPQRPRTTTEEAATLIQPVTPDEEARTRIFTQPQGSPQGAEDATVIFEPTTSHDNLNGDDETVTRIQTVAPPGTDEEATRISPMAGNATPITSSLHSRRPAVASIRAPQPAPLFRQQAATA
jgi:serine/threonine protein kinase